MISPQTIEQITNRIDIIDVVGEFVKLKKRGANYLGLCPFHNEKTPSFTVSPSKEIYKCFGCGKSGNTITFLMEHEKYSYAEALKWLAQRYNIEIQETEVSDETRTIQQAAESLHPSRPRRPQPARTRTCFFRPTDSFTMPSLRSVASIMRCGSVTRTSLTLTERREASGATRMEL